MVALLCAVAGRRAGRLPALELPSGARLHRHDRGLWRSGYALAVLSILGTAKVAVALLVLGVPIIDTFWIIIRRLAARQSPFTPDRGHFHHRLLDLGLTHRGAVLLIYAHLRRARGARASCSPAVGPLYAFMGVVIAVGLVLLLMTRRRADEALDARHLSRRRPSDLRRPRRPAGEARGLGAATAAC